MADAGDLYDEFGNYIGPELSESEEVRACWPPPPPPASAPLHDAWQLLRVARWLAATTTCMGSQHADVSLRVGSHEWLF